MFHRHHWDTLQAQSVWPADTTPETMWTAFLQRCTLCGELRVPILHGAWTWPSLVRVAEEESE